MRSYTVPEGMEEDQYVEMLAEIIQKLGEVLITSHRHGET